MLLHVLANGWPGLHVMSAGVALMVLATEEQPKARAPAVATQVGGVLG